MGDPVKKSGRTWTVALSTRVFRCLTSCVGCGRGSDESEAVVWCMARLQLLEEKLAPYDREESFAEKEVVKFEPGIRSATVVIGEKEYERLCHLVPHHAEMGTENALDWCIRRLCFLERRMIDHQAAVRRARPQELAPYPQGTKGSMEWLMSRRN